MQRLDNYIDELLSLALYKTKNIYEAEELVQDTLLTALIYINKCNEIKDYKSYLITILNGKYNDMLRRKYNKPLTYLPDNFDIIDDNNIKENIIKSEEYENVRKAIAFLSKSYRDIIVSYYMDGLSINEISRKYNINENTIKTRLHIARNQIKKGLLDMKSYSKESYSPIRLFVNNSGNQGINGEPHSLVDNDLLAQNILYIAYEKPKTIEEIASEIGVPMAYIEPIIEKLIKNELIKKEKNKYYTDFVIYNHKDLIRHIDDQKQFVNENFEILYSSMDKALEKVKELSFYRSLNNDQQNSLLLWMNYNVFDYGLYDCLQEIVKEKVNFPSRINGGRWIAFGTCYDNDANNDNLLISNSYSGERFAYYKDIYNYNEVYLRAFGTEGFPSVQYDRSPEYTFFEQNVDLDAVIAKLLFVINEDIKPESIGFNVEYLKAIPWLLKCKVLKKDNEKLVVNVPVLNQKQINDVYNIILEAKESFTKELMPLLKEFIKYRKLNVPSHINSVPKVKLYHCTTNALVMSLIRKAINTNKLYNGGYDNEENPIPSAMVLVIDK